MRLNPKIDGAPFRRLIRGHLQPRTPEQQAAVVKALMTANPLLTREGAHAEADRAWHQEQDAEVWFSDQYTVLVYRDTPTGEGFPAMDWLSIRRDDREPIRDWRHMQEIKNQLCGEDREGVEIYPAESRLVDQANQYHLWVFREAGFLPFGFGTRSVVDKADEVQEAMGAKQRARV